MLAACIHRRRSGYEDADYRITSNGDAIDPQHYIAQLSSRDLQPVSLSSRQVTDAMRMRTLRAFGVELHLPVQMPGPLPAGARPVPRQFLSLWVGDKAIDAQLLSNLRSNAERLRASAYNLRLYLSKANSSAFDENLNLLAKEAPGVDVYRWKIRTGSSIFVKARTMPSTRLP
ncbi:hypothetical protein [Pseudomonas sp. CAM1A]|uniref:hypothetical protein n=1 Tax=Pseudomonas sp. CAM1A TaxID=3231717 RepID=UPI0039C65F02